MAFLDLAGLSRFFTNLKDTFASKDCFNRANDGLVPHPTTTTSTRYLREDGTWAVPTNTTYTPASLGFGFGTCATSETTTLKEVTLANYSLVTGGMVAVRFTNAVPANATMSINSKTAKSIFFKGSAIKAGVIKAGDTATFVYDGTQYQLIALDAMIDRLVALEQHAIQDSSS